ncbi:MAG: sugar ABC transporter permease [Lachnospiraceae bacterium]|nr:sugar ABC transporter permease [Lachnospiraceae bacterium]
MKSALFRKQQGKWKLSLAGKDALAGYLFILPFLIGFFVIFLPMIAKSIQFSFSNMTVTSDGYVLETAKNNGFEHYIRALTIDPDFNLDLLTAIGNIAAQVPLIIIFSFFAATLINQKFIGRTFARSVFFFPVILTSGVVLGLESSDLLVSAMGETAAEGEGVASFLDMVRLLREYTSLPGSVITFLSNAVNGLYDIIVASGVQILIFLAGLQSISPSLYEASSMEGATGWESFWKITFPMISPLILVNCIYTIVDSFTNENNEMMNAIRTKIFSEVQYGYGSAMAWIYFVCIALILLVVGGLISRKIFYYDER